MAKINQRKLGCERLENREVMAGNVLATVTSTGMLSLQGDAASNGVEVTYSSVDGYHIKGLTQGGAATTINGHADAWFHANSIGVTLGNGNDLLNTVNCLFNSAGIDMGAGSDTLNMIGTTISQKGDTARIFMGTYGQVDNDTVLLSNDKFYGNLAMYLGGGNDTANFTNTTVYQSLYGDAGPGTDKYRWSNSYHGPVTGWSGFDGTF